MYGPFALASVCMLLMGQNATSHWVPESALGPHGIILFSFFFITLFLF